MAKKKTAAITGVGAYLPDYILDNMNEGFVLLDTDQNILLINASACRAFGVKKTEAQGKNILHKRIVLRGIQAVCLIVRQSGSLHFAALRQIPRVAKQVKFRRAEGEQQRKTADAKPSQPDRNTWIVFCRSIFPTK